MLWNFACESDLHFDQAGTCLKPNSVQKIITFNKTNKLDFVVCPGDLTDTGADGGCCSKSLNELAEFVDQYVSPLEANGIPVKATVGNHDFNKGRYPCAGIVKYIQRKYDATYSWSNYDMSGCYTYTHNGVQFISLGVYPKNLKWLSEVLPSDKQAPLIIYYHYNPDKNEPFGDWWTDEEKLAFYTIIKDYNVLLIINGHWHTTRVTMWNNFKIIHCAGNPVVIKMIDQQVQQVIFM